MHLFLYWLFLIVGMLTALGGIVFTMNRGDPTIGLSVALGGFGLVIVAWSMGAIERYKKLQ